MYPFLFYLFKEEKINIFWHKNCYIKMDIICEYPFNEARAYIEMK